MHAVHQPAQHPTWDDMREPLRAALGADYFGRWFAKVTGRVAVEDGVAVLSLFAPNKFQADWIAREMDIQVEAVWRSLAPGGRVEFGVEEAAPEPEATPTALAQVIQLDFWEDGKRAAPNAVLRAALFPAVNKKQSRRYLEEERLFSVRGVEVFFTGKQFDQSDLDVYLEILNFARPFPLGTPVKFAAHGMLKALGRATGNMNHQWLHSVLLRLRGGTVDITDHKIRYFGGLIEGGFKDELTKHYEVTINPKFAVLFGLGMWATIDRAQRQALGLNATAKALHAYYSSHAAPTAHHFDTLAGIAGLSNRNTRQRRADIIKAHDLMQAEEVGFLQGYDVQGDMIAVDINHTPGQNRHLVQRLLKAKKHREK